MQRITWHPLAPSGFSEETSDWTARTLCSCGSDLHLTILVQVRIKIEAMENADSSRCHVVDAPCAADHGAANDSSRFGWMPNSGYGPYCTIPFSAGVGDERCRSIGLASFVSARREARILADEYAGQALALKAKARQERHLLSIAIRGPGGEALIRPNRVRLCLDWSRSAGYLYLGWCGVVRCGSATAGQGFGRRDCGTAKVLRRPWSRGHIRTKWSWLPRSKRKQLKSDGAGSRWSGWSTT